MSVSTEVERIELAKQNLSTYLKQQGVADGTEKIDVLIRKAIDAMSTFGERLDALEAKTMYDAVLSDTSVLAPQTKAVKAYVDENSGGSEAFASMFDIGMPGEFYVQDADETSVQNAIRAAINTAGFAVAIGTSNIKWQEPQVIVPPIEWSPTVDDNYDFTAEVDIRVQFGNAGSISKTITVKRPGEGKLYAVRSENNAYIDTGIAGDYSYTFRAKGHTRSTNQCVFIDAFVSTSARTTLRVLGSSNKLQHMWSANREVTSSSVGGMDFKKMFEVEYGANKLKLTQNGQTYTPSITGHTTSGTVGTNIRLMGSSTSGFNNCVVAWLEIVDSNGNVLGHWAPYKIRNDEIVMINTNGLTAQEIYDIVQNGDNSAWSYAIFRPETGYLVEVTQEQDEAA